MVHLDRQGIGRIDVVLRMYSLHHYLKLGLYGKVVLQSEKRRCSVSWIETSLGSLREETGEGSVFKSCYSFVSGYTFP